LGPAPFQPRPDLRLHHQHQNSGLFDYLLPSLKKAGIKVDVVAGHQHAIEISKGGLRRCLYPAKELELKPWPKDYFIDRHDVMYNDFVLIGPLNDPAKIKESSHAEAFGK
jgi:tungstate transport system substrate-binding protein